MAGATKLDELSAQREASRGVVDPSARARARHGVASRSARLQRHRFRPGVEARPKRLDRPRCGARCRSRAGAPCRASVVVDRGAAGRIRVRARCRMHGGLSTGAKTLEGRARLSEAGRRGGRERWRRWREQREGRDDGSFAEDNEEAT